MPRTTAAALAATAHHEAGHAVAAILLRVRFAHVTIRPAGDAAGHVRYLRPARSVDQVHRRGIVALTGEAAQRRHNPRSVRTHHGIGDRHAVLAYALGCTGSAKQAEAMAKLWTVQAEELVEARWAKVVLIAGLLLERGSLTQGECSSALMPAGVGVDLTNSALSLGKAADYLDRPSAELCLPLTRLS